MLDDPDAWRSRKTVDPSSPLRDIAHPERSIRGFLARRLAHTYKRHNMNKPVHKADGRNGYNHGTTGCRLATSPKGQKLPGVFTSTSDNSKVTCPFCISHLPNCYELSKKQEAILEGKLAPGAHKHETLQVTLNEVPRPHISSKAEWKSLIDQLRPAHMTIDQVLLELLVPSIPTPVEKFEDGELVDGQRKRDEEKERFERIHDAAVKNKQGKLVLVTADDVLFLCQFALARQREYEGLVWELGTELTAVRDALETQQRLPARRSKDRQDLDDVKRVVGDAIDPHLQGRSLLTNVVEIISQRDNLRSDHVRHSVQLRHHTAKIRQLEGTIASMVTLLRDSGFDPTESDTHVVDCLVKALADRAATKARMQDTESLYNNALMQCSYMKGVIGRLNEELGVGDGELALDKVIELKEIKAGGAMLLRDIVDALGIEWSKDVEQSWEAVLAHIRRDKEMRMCAVQDCGRERRLACEVHEREHFQGQALVRNISDRDISFAPGDTLGPDEVKIVSIKPVTDPPKYADEGELAVRMFTCPACLSQANMLCRQQGKPLHLPHSKRVDLLRSLRAYANGVE